MKLIIMWSIFVYCIQAGSAGCVCREPSKCESCKRGSNPCCCIGCITASNTMSSGTIFIDISESQSTSTPVDLYNCGGIDNCAVYATGHQICECVFIVNINDFGEHCFSNELSDEYISSSKCTKCINGHILNTTTSLCENLSDINIRTTSRRRLIMTNDNSITMSIGIIMGALIVLSIIIGVLIVFHYKQKSATVELLENVSLIEVV
eukprot:337830_1